MAHTREIYIHPAPVRVWHWLNAFFFLVLIGTGLQIRFAEILKVISLEDAIKLHNYIGISLIFNYGLWVGYYFGTGKIRIYFPNPRTFIEKAKSQVIYYTSGIFKGDTNPHHVTPDNKFNVLQQKAYLGIMFVLLPAQMVTGLFLWRIKSFQGYINMLGGIKIINSIHVVLFFFFSAFIIVHAYLATLGHTPLAHYRAMFTGFEEEEVDGLEERAAGVD